MRLDTDAKLAWATNRWLRRYFGGRIGVSSPHSCQIIGVTAGHVLDGFVAARSFCKDITATLGGIRVRPGRTPNRARQHSGHRHVQCQ